ncbi:ADP-ribosylation/Crystallin J1 [Sporodiniella umbellata]|nr:ADP-ribosylation/Crystallin J1 [Sporodiniella umbellata]
MHIPSGCSKIENSIIIDKIKGLIFGAILGDSIGIATEGMKRDEIKAIYGKGPVRFGMDEDGMPFITDDYRSFFDENDYGANTEHVLLVIESVLENNGHLHSKDLASRLSEHKANLHHFKDTNSALVRASLLGALKFWDGTSVIENSTYSCQMTHPNPSCMMSSVVISILIARYPFLPLLQHILTLVLL